MKPKVLCLCSGGNVRSVRVAFLLKDAGIDAIAAGIHFNGIEAIKLLVKWADFVWTADADVDQALKNYYLDDKAALGDKLIGRHIGPDIYGFHCHPDLAYKTQFETLPILLLQIGEKRIVELNNVKQ